MLLYALGAASCEPRPQYGAMPYRVVGSLVSAASGPRAPLHGEAKVVPEKRRVKARREPLHLGAQWASSPAALVKLQDRRVLVKARPESHQWHYVFLCGLIPTLRRRGHRARIREGGRPLEERSSAAATSRASASSSRRSSLAPLRAAAGSRWRSCRPHRHGRASARWSRATVSTSLADTPGRAASIACRGTRLRRGLGGARGQASLQLGGLIGALLHDPGGEGQRTPPCWPPCWLS